MLSSLNTYYISMAAMLGKFEIKMGAVFKNLSEIVFTELCAMKPKKSSYKFINSYLTEFAFNNEFEWDFKNYKNGILTNQKQENIYHK